MVGHLMAEEQEEKMIQEREKLYNEINESLQGSCQSLSEVLEAHNATHLEDDEDFLNFLDQETMKCETCDWWVEVSELNEDNNCRDCAEE